MSVWRVKGQYYAGGKTFEYNHCLEGSFSDIFVRDIERTLVLTPERLELAKRVKPNAGEREGFGMTITQYLKLRNYRRELSPHFKETDA